ncbi:MAG: radical SAM protein [Halobacteriota archaeon]
MKLRAPSFSRDYEPVVLKLRSQRGRQYLFDDVTGSIFPWNELFDAVLTYDISNAAPREWQELAVQFGKKDVLAAHRFIRHWRDNYGAFVRTWNASDWVPCPPDIDQYIRNRSFELLLILTENCNLRCRYCALSETYPLNRVRTDRKMSIGMARRAVDWYVELVQPQTVRNPQKRFGLSFYGGEPMMNMPVLKSVLEHCSNNYPDMFLPVMTTNGTLLSPANVRVLVHHNVTVIISIDGPAEEHDRFRVDARNRGTFEKVVKNLRWLKENFPDYWTTNVMSASVFDWSTDIELVEKFFNENADVIPRANFVSSVSSWNTNWYTQYTDGERGHFISAIRRLREQYKTSKIEGRATSHYLNGLVGSSILMVRLRRRLLDDRPSFMPFSGTCIPGEKIAVHVDGKIDMCERVNGSYPIGHLDRGGIDYTRLTEIINRYQTQVLFDCPKCPVTKLCGVCFSKVEGHADFAKVPLKCADTVEDAMHNLTDYVSILEENPKADLMFETDTARLEERLLVDY